jgi:hypothetical protein
MKLYIAIQNQLSMKLYEMCVITLSILYSHRSYKNAAHINE